MSTDPFDGVELPTTGSSNEIGQPTFVELIWADECITSPAISGKTPSTFNAINQLAFGKDCIDKLATIVPGDPSLGVVDNQLLPKDVNRPTSDQNPPDASLPANDKNNDDRSGDLGSDIGPQTMKYSLSSGASNNDYRSLNASSEFDSLLFNPVAFSNSQCEIPQYDLNCGTEDCMVDAVFAIDTSGSMGGAIAAVKSAAAQMAALIKQVSGQSYRLSLYSLGHLDPGFFQKTNTNTIKDSLCPSPTSGTCFKPFPVRQTGPSSYKITSEFRTGSLYPIISLSPGKCALSKSNAYRVGDDVLAKDVYDLPVAYCDNLDQFERWIDLPTTGSYEPMHQICEAIASDGQQITNLRGGTQVSFTGSFRSRSQTNGKVLFIITDENLDIDFASMKRSCAEMAKCGWSMMYIHTGRSTVSPNVLNAINDVFTVIPGTYVFAPRGQNMYELASSFILSACSSVPVTFECPVGINYVKNGKFDTSIANWNDVSGSRGIPERNISWNSEYAALEVNGAAEQQVDQNLTANEKVILNFNASTKPNSSGALSAQNIQWNLRTEIFSPPVSVMPQIINPDENPERDFSGVGIVGSTTSNTAYASIETTNLDITEAYPLPFPELTVDFQFDKQNGDLYVINSNNSSPLLLFYENMGLPSSGASDCDIRDIDLSSPTNTIDLSSDLTAIYGFFVVVKNVEVSPGVFDILATDIYINAISTSAPDKRIVKYTLATPGNVSTLTLDSDLSTDGAHNLLGQPGGVCVVGNGTTSSSLLICHGNKVSQFNTLNLTLLSTLSPNSTRTFNPQKELGLASANITKICIAQIKDSDDPDLSNSVLRQAYLLVKDDTAITRLIRGSVSSDSDATSGAGATWQISDLGIEEGREFGNGIKSFDIDGIADVASGSYSFNSAVKHWTLKLNGSAVEINQRISQKVGYFCSCSAIHDNLVLSAAHCVASSSTITPPPPIIANTARVTFKSKTYRCDDIRIHPDYQTKPNAFDGDAAILRIIGSLDTDIDQYGLSALTNLYPSFISTADDSVISVVGNDVEIVGYGRTGIQDSSEQSLPPYTFGQKRSGTQTIDEVTNVYLRYVMDSGESAAFRGDSGGPMFDQIGGEYFIAGIVSYGDPPEGGVLGSIGTTVSYTRLAYIESWLINSIEDMAGRQLIFKETWESLECPVGEFRLYKDPGGFLSEEPFEIQNNVPGVGPAFEGQKLGELDGLNKIWVFLATDVNNTYEIDFYYSPRPGLSLNENKIDVFWDGQFIVTIADDGTNNTSTAWRQVKLSLPKPTTTNTRLMFASKDDPGFGAGGLLDLICAYESFITDGGDPPPPPPTASGKLTYKILSINGAELATDFIDADNLGEGPSNSTNLSLETTLVTSENVKVLFTTEDGVEDDFIIDDVTVCALSDADCEGGSNNLVVNGKFENGVQSWTDENGVPLNPGTSWDPISKAIIFSLTTNDEIRQSIVEPSSAGQTLFLYFEVSSLEPEVIAELSFDYGILDKNGTVVKKSTFIKQNTAIPTTLELEFKPPSDGEFQVFFSTGTGISGTAKIRNVLICGPISCEDGYSLITKDTFENSTGGWTGGVWNQQEKYLELEKNADSFKSAAVQPFSDLTPLTTFRATYTILEVFPASQVRLELASGDDEQQLFISSAGTYSIEIPVAFDGSVTAKIFNDNVTTSVAVDLIVCCESNVLTCDGSIDTINGMLEWQGTPRVPINIFNAFIKYKIRNPLDPFDITEEIFAVNAEGRLSVVTCDLWKSEKGSADILSKGIGNTSNINNGDLVNVETKKDWLWSIPQSGASTAAGQDNLIAFYDGPGSGKLIENAELFVLANRINPTPGTNIPKPYGCDSGDDPATTLNIIIQYVNSENLNKEFSQAIAISELYPNDYDFTGFNWDDDTATGNGYAGEVARWESYQFNLDLPNGKGLDQCTPPIISDDNGIGSLILPKLTMVGKGSFFDPCDAEVLIEDTSGQSGFGNEIQSITLPNPTGGTWDITFNRSSDESGVPQSATLQWNVTRNELREALEGFNNIGPGNVSVSGKGTGSDPFLVEFIGALASTNLPLLQTNQVKLVGSSNAFVSTIVNGTVNERQKISNPADNRVSLSATFDGVTSVDIPYAASLNDIQSALEGITTIGAGNISVTGSQTDRDARYVGDYIVDFIGSLAGQNVPMISVNPAYVSEVIWNGGLGANEEQRLTINDVVGGTYNLTVFNQDGSDFGITTDLGFNETPGNIKSAILNACSFLSSSDIDVTDIPSAENRYRRLIVFGGLYSGLNMPQISVDGSTLIGGAVLINRTQSGTGSNESQIVTLLRATGGSFKLTVAVDGIDYKTTAIPWNTTAKGLEQQLEALPPFIENKGITVVSLEKTNSEQNARFEVLFDKSYGNIPLMIADFQQSLLCNPIVLTPVDPGPYDYELEDCDEIDDDYSCQSGPLLCKPGEGGPPIEDEICCNSDNIPDEANISRRIKINRDLFTPNKPSTIRDLAVIKGISPSEYTPYIRNLDNSLTETSFNITVSTKMSIVLIKDAINTSSNQRRLKEYLSNKEMILPARFTWPDCDTTATNAADDCWPTR